MAFYHWLKRYAEDPETPDKADWIASRLLALRELLRDSPLGGRQPNSLVIGSWNIRAFDEGRPRRDESFHYIAEIIDRFDICAVQEIKQNLGSVDKGASHGGLGMIQHCSLWERSCHAWGSDGCAVGGDFRTAAG